VWRIIGSLHGIRANGKKSRLRSDQQPVHPTYRFAASDETRRRLDVEEGKEMVEKWG
jgi:hypothetical protein